MMAGARRFGIDGNNGLKGGTVTQRLLGIDGRSRAARALTQEQNRLLAICSTPAAAALAERGAQLKLLLLRLDARALATDGGLTDSEAKVYVTLSGSYARIVAKLETLSRAKVPRYTATGAGTSLEQHVAQRLAEREARP